MWDDSKKLYILRVRKKDGSQQWVETGSASFATPKLYYERDAKRVLANKQKRPQHPDWEPWEMVPVNIVYSGD